MKKKYRIILAALVVLVSSLVYLKDRAQKPVECPLSVKQAADGGLLTDRSNAGSGLDDFPRQRGEVFTPGTEAYSNRIANAGMMSEEEALLVEEAFEITAAMSEFLDDDDNDGALIEARKFVNHPNREVRLAAVQALQWIGAAAAIDIVSYMGDADPEIDALANEAFWLALDEIDDPVLKISVLEPILHSSSTEQRIEVLDMLIYLPDHLSFPVIAGLMNDSVEEVRDLARENLEFISEEEFASKSEALTWFNAHKDELSTESSF